MSTRNRVVALSRPFGVVLALVLGLLAALVLDIGHPAEASDLHGAVSHAISTHHDHGEGGSADAPWHAVHCGSHCAGHAVTQPESPVATVLPAIREVWAAVAAQHLTSQAPPVQDRPPRG